MIAQIQYWSGSNQNIGLSPLRGQTQNLPVQDCSSKLITSCTDFVTIIIFWYFYQHDLVFYCMCYLHTLFDVLKCQKGTYNWNVFLFLLLLLSCHNLFQFVNESMKNAKSICLTKPYFSTNKTVFSCKLEIQHMNNWRMMHLSGPVA